MSDAVTTPAPWDADAVAHLPIAERKAAYFRWHKRTKAACKRLGIQMPVRPKRAKATTQEERLERLRAQNKRYRQGRKDRDKVRHAAYYAENRKRLLAAKKADRQSNPQKYAQRQRARYVANVEAILAATRTPEVRAARNARHKTRTQCDLNYRMRRHLRKHLHWCVKQYGMGRARKAKSIVVLLGCDIAAFVAHIEALWQPGMSWDNYGLHGWHIDHIRPCASFDFSDEAQQRACFHYSNMQPLWAVENHRKGARHDWERMAA